MANQNNPGLVRALVVSGVIVIAISVVLAATVTPWAALGILVAVSDFALAWAFARGRVGGKGASGTAAQGESDPAYNPYARED